MLEQLGIERSEEALPTTTVCPKCHTASLEILEDAYWNGQWFHCGKCKVGGDMLQLAAWTWGLSVESALNKLIESGIPSLSPTCFNDLYKGRLNRYSRAKKFREESHSRPLHHSTAATRLVHELGWHSGVPATRFAAGPGQLFGCASHFKAEQLFHLPLRDDYESTEKPKKTKLFVGGGWGDVLVVAFEDLPGRPCGFLFVGRDGNPKSDFVYHSAIQGRTAVMSSRAVEAGLAAHPRVGEAARKWKNKLIAIGDTSTVIKLQCKQFIQSLDPLPMLSWWRGVDRLGRWKYETTTAWSSYHKNQLVFWMPELDIQTLLFAIRNNGEIAMLGPPIANTEAWRIFLSKQEPKKLTERLMTIARPWAQVLSKLFAEMSDSAIEEVLRQLALRGLDFDEVTSRLRKDVRDRVTEILDVKQRIRQIRVDAGVITEQSDSWFHRKTSTVPKRFEVSELICDAVLIIDEIIHRSGTDDTCYRGRVRYRGKEAGFCEMVKTIERRPTAWLRQFVLDKFHATLRYNAGFSASLLPIAIRFRKPDYVEGLAAVGWNEREARFEFPAFSIAYGGGVRKHGDLPNVGEVPCLRLRPPEPCSAADIEAITADELGAGLIWSSMAAILTSVIAPAVREEAPAIGMFGMGATATCSKVAEAMGCLSERLTMLKSRKMLHLRSRMAEHNWPMLIDYRYGNSLTGAERWLEAHSDSPVPCITALSEQTALAAKCTEQWLVISSRRSANWNASLNEPIRRITVAYLDSFCRRKPNFHAKLQEMSLAEAVTEDLRQFVSAVHKSGNSVADVANYMAFNDATTAVEALVEVLASQISKGRLQIVPESYSKTGDVRSIVQRTDGLLISRRLFSPQARQIRIRTLDQLRITAILAANNALVGEEEHGWVVSQRWWNKQFHRYHVRTTGLMRA